MAALPIVPVVPAKKSLTEVALKAAEVTKKLKVDADKAVSVARDADRELSSRKELAADKKADLKAAEASLNATFQTKLAVAEANVKKASPQEMAKAVAALQKVRADMKEAKDELNGQKMVLRVEEAKLAEEVKRVGALKLSAENAVKLALGKGKTRSKLWRKKGDKPGDTIIMPPWDWDGYPRDWYLDLKPRAV
jgi:hypothetical protein